MSECVCAWQMWFVWKKFQFYATHRIKYILLYYKYGISSSINFSCGKCVHSTPVYHGTCYVVHAYDWMCACLFVCTEFILCMDDLSLPCAFWVAFFRWRRDRNSRWTRSLGWCMSGLFGWSRCHIHRWRCHIHTTLRCLFEIYSTHIRNFQTDFSLRLGSNSRSSNMRLLH